jgi:hypothetical protein
MRSLFVLSLLVVLSAPGNASARGHHARSQNLIERSGQPATSSQVTPGGLRIYRDDSVPGGLRTDHDPVPSYDDPSRRGSG